MFDVSETDYIFKAFPLNKQPESYQCVEYSVVKK